MIPITLNGQPAVGLRVSLPRGGVWFADVDFDLVSQAAPLPAGRAALVVGASILSGTVDPEASGRFGSKARVRVVGGGNGWQKLVPAQHFHNDFGVLSTSVLQATATLVGEVVADVTPTRFEADYVRTAGPASRVLADFDWYVDPTGITIVGPRPPVPLSLGADILTWDAKSRRAEIASDELVMPGTLLVDPRFGTATVQDVEQTFSADGARAVVWCKPSDAPAKMPAGARLARALATAAREAAGVSYLRRYKYRIVSQAADRLTLQAVDLTADAPAFLQSVAVWGPAGISATYKPSTQAHVVFVDGDPSQPVVVAFDDALPLVTKIDGAQVTVGEGSSHVALAEAVVTALNAVAANAGLTSPAMAAALLPILPTIASTKLRSD